MVNDYCMLSIPPENWFHFSFQIDIETYRYKKADTEIRCYYTYEPLRADIITASPISAAHAAVRSISL